MKKESWVPGSPQDLSDKHYKREKPWEKSSPSPSTRRGPGKSDNFRFDKGHPELNVGKKAMERISWDEYNATLLRGAGESEDMSGLYVWENHKKDIGGVSKKDDERIKKYIEKHGRPSPEILEGMKKCKKCKGLGTSTGLPFGGLQDIYKVTPIKKVPQKIKEQLSEDHKYEIRDGSYEGFLEDQVLILTEKQKQELGTEDLCESCLKDKVKKWGGLKDLGDDGSHFSFSITKK